MKEVENNKIFKFFALHIFYPLCVKSNTLSRGAFEVTVIRGGECLIDKAERAGTRGRSYVSNAIFLLNL